MQETNILNVTQFQQSPGHPLTRLCNHQAFPMDLHLLNNVLAHHATLRDPFCPHPGKFSTFVVFCLLL